jgi:hypothetical protein
MVKSASTTKAASASTAVVVKSAPAAIIKPSADLMAEFSGMASSGLENVTANDVIIPRLTILQALSPQVTKSKPEFIKGAEQGNFCDTGTNEIFVDSISVIPCFFARVFLEWAPRSSGKGLVKNHGIDASILDKCTPDDKGRQTLPNGNLIAETATYYVLNMSAGGRRSFIPMYRRSRLRFFIGSGTRRLLNRATTTVLGTAGNLRPVSRCLRWTMGAIGSTRRRRFMSKCAAALLLAMWCQPLAMMPT